jgi:hypothetical protein
MSDHDDLLSRARARAESSRTPDDWGSQMETAENSGGRLRFRGETVDEFRHDHEGNPRRIFLWWDEDGNLVWTPPWYQLVQEVERIRPQVGDTVGFWRGADYQTKNGGPGFSFGLEKESNDEPPQGVSSVLEDVPF